MSQINEEQKDKKEQPLETPQNIKKPKGLDPASNSPLPDWLAGFLAVCIVVVMGMIISQIATTATTSKSQQSAKASVCPDGSQPRRAVSVDDFDPYDSYDIIIVGQLWVDSWASGRAEMAMTDTGPSRTVYVRPRDYQSFLRKYRQYRQNAFVSSLYTPAVGMVMKDGQIVDLISTYTGAIRNGILCVRE